MKYIAKPDTWFEAGTEVELLVDCSPPPGGGDRWGIFKGIHEGRIDEEGCSFEEFIEIEE